MPTGTRNSSHLSWRSILHSVIAALPSLRSREKTRLPWASLIESYTTVPEVYTDFFDPLRTAGRDFPYTVLTPAYENFIYPTTEKLISDLGNEIYVLERSGNTFTSLCYPTQGIIYVERGTMLLDSWLKICGLTGQDGLKTTTLKFNTVTDFLFAPILKCIRFASVSDNDAVLSSELKKFDHLSHVNYKFMNYAKRSLLGDEKVIQTFLQPEIRKAKLPFLGKSYNRTISPTHITILTDQELIVIREDENWRDQTRYGGIWDFIPLNKIVSLNYSEKGEDLLELSIHLTEGACLNFLNQTSTKPEIERLIAQLNKLALIQVDK